MGEWRVKYDGACSRCGVLLRAGDIAVYERSTRTIHCVSCPTAPASGPPEIDAGVAGRSARQEHERRAAKRETEVRGRWGDRIGGVVLALTEEPQSTKAWAVGARGEEKLAKALDGLSVLHDRRVPGTKGNIDHIVIAPAVGVRDGYVAGNVATGKAKARGDAHIPSYVRPDVEHRRAMAKRGLDQLLRDFPGNVATGREFTN